MKIVYKQQLQPIDKQLIRLPVGSIIISADNQRENICIWYMFDKETKELEDRTILILGTGHTLQTNKSILFIRTIIMAEGNLVFHVFEELK